MESPLRGAGSACTPEAPAQWLTENRSVLSGLDGRRALDIACGDGRNAAYLARLGFEVDAVDVSDVAIDALQAAATDRRLSVRPLRLDLERNFVPARITRSSCSSTTSSAACLNPSRGRSRPAGS